MDEVKKHLSHSQIQTYINCPAHWLFSYRCGIKIPPKASMMQGRSIHKSLAEGYFYKKDKGKEIKLKEMLDIYEDDFNKSIQNEEVSFKKDEKPAGFIDVGVKGLKLYHSEMMPNIKPVEIEKEFLLDFENTDFSFKGVIDLIDDKDIVHDHKSTGKTPNQVQIDNDQQLSAYTVGFEKIIGRKPEFLQLDYLVLTKEPKIVSFRTERNDADIKRWLMNIAFVKKAIDSGLFYCVHSGANSWVCTKDYCKYEELGYHKELYKIGVNKFIEKYGQGGNSEILYEQDNNL